MRDATGTRLALAHLLPPAAIEASTLSARNDDTVDLTMSHRRLGARVREARKQAGRSQAEAAETLGISYQQWQKYEAGQNRLSAVSLHRLAGFLNADVRWLLGVLDEDAPKAGPKAERFVAAFGALREQDQEMLLALAEHLAQNTVNASRTVPVFARTNGRMMTTEPHKILVVDDDADALTVVGMMLRNGGFNVTLASNGDMAFAKLATEGPFDILVTDYAMPGLNGLALIELARERQPDLPAILISGYALDAALRELPAGVDILTKPFTRGDIVSHLQRLGAQGGSPAQGSQRQGSQERDSPGGVSQGEVPPGDSPSPQWPQT